MSFVQEHTNDDGQGWPYAVKDTTAGMQQVERIRTNIGHIRVKMSGTNFPDRIEGSERKQQNDPAAITFMCISRYSTRQTM